MKTLLKLKIFILTLIGLSTSVALASEACPTGAMIALQNPTFANKLISDSKIEMVHCEKSNLVISKQDVYVVLHLLQRQNGDFSAVLSLYKTEGFSLSSTPVMVRRELSSEIFPFKLNGKKRLLALADVNGDGKEEILMNLAVGGDSTGLLIFAAGEKEFQQLKMDILGSSAVAESNADFIMSFAAREIELTSSGTAFSALISRPTASNKINVITANIKVLNENKAKK